MKRMLILCLVLFCTTESLLSQKQSASALLSTAIYEEEVSGNLDKAIEIYLDIIKRYPDDRPVAAKALYHLGLATEKMGRGKADEYYSRIIANYPEQTDLVNLARAKLSRLNSSESETMVKAGQSFREASDLFKKSRFEPAVDEFEKVIRLAPDSRLAEEARLWIGQCYFRLKDYNRALTTFRAMTIGVPDSPMIPVADLMISQIQQILTQESGPRPFLFPDENTILDPNTNIRYTLVNSLAGKDDVITAAALVKDISPDRKFIVAQNKIYFFDNSKPVVLFEDSSNFRPECRLSPDGSKIACLSEKKILLIPVSPETGHPSGPAREFPNVKNQNWRNLSWSPDSRKLIFAVFEDSARSRVWTFSTADGSLEPVTNSYLNGFISHPVFSENGSNVLFFHRGNQGYFSLKMASIEKRKTVTLIDSSRLYSRFMLSPDNQWVLYEKPSRDKFLYRLEDRQEQKLIIPKEVGEVVGWADDGQKMVFYHPSFENRNSLKVISAFGGPSFELDNQKGLYLRDWYSDSKSLLATGSGPDGTYKSGFLSLRNQEFREISGIDAYTFSSFSPDFSKVIVNKNTQGKPTDLLVFSFSTKDLTVVGDSLVIFNGYVGYGYGYSWSPDGKKIVVCTGGEIWICDPEGGVPQQLTRTPEKEEMALWSPDGKYIATRIAQGDFKIIRVSDQETILTHQPVDSWSWSPDGSEIALACYDYSLVCLSIPTGKIRFITDWKKLCNSSYLDGIYWSPDGKWIAVHGPADEVDLISKIFLVQPGDGKVTELAAEDPASKESICWSPDSKWIAYSTLGPNKTRLESTFWEADLTEFMKAVKPGNEKGLTTDFDFLIPGDSADSARPDGTFTDPRDGQIYPYKNFGNQTWMTENLAFLSRVCPGPDSSGVAERYYVYGYDGLDVIVAKNTANYQKYGVLYNYAGARKACPAGWHLPGDEEWMELERFLGMDTADLKRTSNRTTGNVGNRMKSVNYCGDDDLLLGQSGFDVLPGGYRRSLPEYYRGIDSMAAFWTFSSQNELIPGGRFIYQNSSTISRTLTVGKTAGFSVRCVRD